MYKMDLPGYNPNYEPNLLQINKLLQVIETAKTVNFSWAGILHAKASKELTSFARKYEIPVVHTLLGLGGFPPDDELFLGMGECTVLIQPIWRYMNATYSLI